MGAILKKMAIFSQGNALCPVENPFIKVYPTINSFIKGYLFESIVPAPIMSLSQPQLARERIIPSTNFLQIFFRRIIVLQIQK